MSLKYALLGLLSERPASGYALTQRFEQSLQKYAWHANHSQIYPELAKLAADDLAAVVEEGARGRRTYAITDAGREALREWLLTSSGGPRRVRNEAVLRTFLLSTLEPGNAVQLLRGYVDRSAQDLADLQAVVAELEAAENAGEPQRFGRFAAEFGVRQYAAFHDWAQWALARVESAAPHEPDHERTTRSRPGVAAGSRPRPDPKPRRSQDLPAHGGREGGCRCMISAHARRPACSTGESLMAYAPGRIQPDRPEQPGPELTDGTGQPNSGSEQAAGPGEVGPLSPAEQELLRSLVADGWELPVALTGQRRRVAQVAPALYPLAVAAHRARRRVRWLTSGTHWAHDRAPNPCRCG